MILISIPKLVGWFLNDQKTRLILKHADAHATHMLIPHFPLHHQTMKERKSWSQKLIQRKQRGRKQQQLTERKYSTFLRRRVRGSRERWRLRSSSLGSCCVRGGRLVSASAAGHGLGWSGTPAQTRWGFYWTCGRWCLSRCRQDGRGTTGRSGTWKNSTGVRRVGRRLDACSNCPTFKSHLLIIRRWTILRMMILSAQSFRKSDIFCFSWGFISCLAMTFRWSQEALQRRSIWHRFSCSWSKSTWHQRPQNQKKSSYCPTCCSSASWITCFRISCLSRACNGANLRVEVRALREVLHHHRANVMQQGLLMNRVLHLWNLLQICQLEAFRLTTQEQRLITNEDCNSLHCNCNSLGCSSLSTPITQVLSRWVCSKSFKTSILSSLDSNFEREHFRFTESNISRQPTHFSFFKRQKQLACFYSVSHCRNW